MENPMNQSQSEPLRVIDGNVQQANPFETAVPADSKPAPAFSQESQQHQSLYNKFLHQEKTGQQQGNYVSPSDNIMSPASAKLNAFKERRFAKQAKPRTLFANTKSLSSSRLEDCSPTVVQEQQTVDNAKDEETKQ